jgi:hypothetical protein
VVDHRQGGRSPAKVGTVLAAATRGEVLELEGRLRRDFER